MNSCFLILILLCCCNNGPVIGSGTGCRPGPGTGCRPGSGTGCRPGPETGCRPGPETGCRPERPLCDPDPRSNFPNFPGSGTCGCDEKPVS